MRRYCAARASSCVEDKSRSNGLDSSGGSISCCTSPSFALRGTGEHTHLSVVDTRGFFPIDVFEDTPNLPSGPKKLMCDASMGCRAARAIAPGLLLTLGVCGQANSPVALRCVTAIHLPGDAHGAGGSMQKTGAAGLRRSSRCALYAGCLPATSGVPSRDHPPNLTQLSHFYR